MLPPVVRRLLSLLVLPLWALAGCSAGEDSGDSRMGGTLRVGFLRQVEIDPWTTRDPDSLPFLSLLHEGLVRFDSTGAVTLAHAESWRVSPDGLRYTFELAPGRRYEDGTPVLAPDYARALDAVFEARQPFPGRTRFWSIEGATAKAWRRTVDLRVDAVDSLRLVIQLAAPDPLLLEKLASPRFAVPKAPEGVRGVVSEIPSSGPFRVAREAPGEVLLVRNEQYGGTAPGFVDTVEIRTGVTGRRGVQGLDSGRIDLFWPVPLRYRDRLRRDSELGHVESDSTARVAWYLVLNSAVLPTGRNANRRAIGAAINRSSLTDHFSGAVTPTRRFGPPEEPGEGRAPAFDPAECQELLALSGYPRGFPLPIAVIEGSRAEEVGEELLRDLGVAGLLAELRSMGGREFWSSLANRRGSVAWLLAATPTARHPLAEWAELLLNSSLDTRWTGNLGFYRQRGEALDSLFLRALSSPEDADRDEAFGTLTRWLAEDLPVIPIASAKAEVFHRPRVHGLEFHPELQFDLRAVWLEQPSSS